jgi:gluconate 5-dehydrogenase
VAHLGALGITADAFAADLTQLAAIKELVPAVVARHGPIDILVNNAGATWGAPAETYPLEAWAKVINVNLTGAFVLTQQVAATCFLARGRGRILNISSTEGLQGHHPRMQGTVAYNASKGATINMTRALAAEWGPKGITVNALAPGYFRSKMTTATLDKFEQHLIDQTPLGKLGGADDLKGAALLLASDAGGHITGQVLVIDGGASII